MNMNFNSGRVTSVRMRGFSMIELLVGLLIGIFMLMGMSTYFVQNKDTYSYQQSQANQQEHERIIATLLGRTIRQAGFSPMTIDRITGMEVAFPGAGGFVSGQIVAGTEAVHTVTVNGEALPQSFPDDTISVRYVGEASMARCDGTAPTIDAVVVDMLSTNGVQFTCRTDGTTDTILFGSDTVNATQQLRVLGLAVGYGEDTDGDGDVDSISRASSVTDWREVKIAELEVHFQAGNRPPQASSFVFVIENSLGTDEQEDV